MHHPTDRIAHTTAFVKPVVEHWLEREIAQWVHPMKDRSDDPSHHERTLACFKSAFRVVIAQRFGCHSTITGLHKRYQQARNHHGPSMFRPTMCYNIMPRSPYCSPPTGTRVVFSMLTSLFMTYRCQLPGQHQLCITVLAAWA